MFIIDLEIFCPADCWIEVDTEQFPSYNALVMGDTAKEAFSKAQNLLSSISVVYYKNIRSIDAEDLCNAIKHAGNSLGTGTSYFHQGLKYTVSYRMIVKRVYDLVII